MAIVEGYPELNAYALGAVEEDDKKQRSLFALEVQLQKTKLCRYHMKGNCKHGSSCRFAHGQDQLLQPPNLQKTRMCPDFLANGKCTNQQCTFAHYENELKEVNICHKTALCTWFLAGKCRNGAECHFAHGEHELKANAKNQGTQSLKTINESSPSQECQPKEPMFIHSSMGGNVPAPLPKKAPMSVPSHVPPKNNQFIDFNAFSPQQPYYMPLQPPPGFMPAYGMMPNMQGCDGVYADATISTPQEVPAMPPSYMPMPPPQQMIQQLAPAVYGLGGDQRAAQQGTEKTWEVTELAVQINMLNEEVKRLQDWIIPPSTQSTNSGSSTQFSSGYRTPPTNQTAQNDDSGDLRSFEEKVAGLQSELKRVIVEGQRCGKIRQSP